MIIVSDVVTLEERGKYQGLIGFSTGVGNVVGPFLAAAFIASSTTTWRAFFWMLSPLAAACAAVTFFLLPSKPPQTTVRDGVKKIDFLGVFAVSVAVIFILLPVSGVSLYVSCIPIPTQPQTLILTWSSSRVVRTSLGMVP